MHLDTLDLRTLFGVFGDIKELRLLQSSQAVVEFTFLLNAFIAWQQMNSKFIKEKNAIISIDW